MLTRPVDFTWSADPGHCGRYRERVHLFKAMNKPTSTSMMRRLSASQRLAIGAMLVALLFLLMPASMHWTIRLTSAWDSGVAVSLAFSWAVVHGVHSQVTQELTEQQDQSSGLLLAFVVVAACASIAGIVVLMGAAKDASDGDRASHIVLAVVTIVLSWMWIHTRFGFHYAHRYFRHSTPGDPSIVNDRGLRFPGGHPPDFLDFMYFAFTIGMASQVSDVAVTSRSMRRLTFAHAMISFGFNLSIIALTINILSSAIG